MTLLKTALAVPVLIFSTAAWAAGTGVPTLDVASACKAAANSDVGVQYDANQCLKSENNARDQLVREWASFPVPDRTRCTATATMGGTASYVENAAPVAIDPGIAVTDVDSPSLVGELNTVWTLFVAPPSTVAGVRDLLSSDRIKLSLRSV